MTILLDLYQQPASFLLGLLLVIIIWLVVWIGLGLWFSAKNKQIIWFIAILIFNVVTVGLLSIIYFIWFKPKEIKNKETKLQEFVKREKAKLASPAETKSNIKKQARKSK